MFVSRFTKAITPWLLMLTPISASISNQGHNTLVANAGAYRR